ncbi:unnamed protein product [Prorocentrum cordatum]|uniref:Uncharacterized protein n=1 Tax=Prorocentrum cordatum TaxID=2364126 RepID=A0ABN9RAV9_9DINO|nr:unnamed protein product [Polarella glacialis]
MDKTSIRRSRTATHLNKQRHNFLAHQCAAPGGRTDSPGGGKGDRKGTLHGGATPWKHRVRRSGGKGGAPRDERQRKQLAQGGNMDLASERHRR